MKKISKGEINARLDALRNSKMDDESYDMTRPANAMCYSMSMPRQVTVYRKCAECGKDFAISFCSHDHETVEDYDTTESFKHYKRQSIVDKFIEAGLEAMLVTNCNDCVRTANVNAYELCVRAHDENEWRISVPSISERTKDKSEDRVIKTSGYEYGLVIDFLRAIDDKNLLPDIKEYDGSDGKKPKRLSYKGIIPYNTAHYNENAGFIKTQIDRALNKVLGLNIVYGADEVKRNLIAIYEQAYAPDNSSSAWGDAQVLRDFKVINKQEDTANALKKLEATQKSEFTVWEYRELLKSILLNHTYRQLSFTERKKSNYQSAYAISTERARLKDKEDNEDKIEFDFSIENIEEDCEETAEIFGSDDEKL